MPETPEEEKKDDGLKAIRTFQGDTQEYIKRKGLSLVEIAAEASKRSDLATKEESNKFSIKKISLISIIIVIIIGVGLGTFWLFSRKAQEKQLASLVPKPILVSDKQIEAAADLKSIQSALKTPIRINSLLYVSMAVKPEEFLKIIKAGPPKELMDSLADKFMLSKFYLNKDWPILIFKIQSYELAFVGTMNWEKGMFDNLKEIFPIKDVGEINEFFEDKEIDNRDTRILRNKNGDIILIYSFINRNYLVIAPDEEPLKEIFRRFSLPQYLND